jgi:hypothetical protein
MQKLAKTAVNSFSSCVAWGVDPHENGGRIIMDELLEAAIRRVKQRWFILHARLNNVKQGK